MRGLSLLLAPAVINAAGWSYKKQEDWGKQPNAECDGQTQSPIDVRTDKTISSCPSKDHLRATAFVQENFMGKKAAMLNDLVDTHALKFSFKTAIGNDELHCAQFHYHFMDSEHQIDGELAFGEQHVVCHQAKYADLGAAVASGEWDALAVFGFMIEIGEEGNDAIQEMIDFKNDYKANEELMVNIPLPKDLATSTYYRYKGSLTTVTCNEIVHWTLFHNPIVISKSQADEIKGWAGDGVLTGNNRYVLPLHGRPVIAYEHGTHKFEGGRVRPSGMDGMCASHTTTSIRSKMYWKDCDAKGMMNEFSFDNADLEDGWGYVKIDDDKDGGRCWSIINPHQARRASIVLKRCKGDPRQQFKMKNGMIWLRTVGNEGQRYCVPFMGEGSKLRSKRCWGGQF